MSQIFDDWKDALSKFKSSIEKDITELRKQKAEICQIRDHINSELSTGKIFRDDDRIIISAPEIIIGNIDNTGELLPYGESKVIVKGRSVNIDGVSESGNINLRAPIINQKAINPGSDGVEEVVESISMITSQAKAIMLQANKEDDVFISPNAGENGGIFIHADSNVVVEANIQAENKIETISNFIQDLEDEKSEWKNNVDNSKSSFESLIKDLEKILDSQKNLFNDEDSTRTNIQDVFDANDQINSLMPSLYSLFCEYSYSVSHLAEVTRKIKKLKEKKEKVVKGDQYKEQTTGAGILISAESIDLESRDGEGNLRDNPGAGISLLANAVSIESADDEGKLNKEGKINISAQNIDINSVDKENLKADENGTLTEGKFEPKGSVNIRSKEINLESIEYEISDNKFKEKSLVKESKLTVAVENIEFSTVDTEGKATGGISMNSKQLSLKSMDMDKENNTDKTLAQGSSMLLLSEKMFLGSKDKETESKLVQTSAETVGTFAKTTYEVQQGEKKGILQMDSGKVEISADKLGLYGEAIVNSKTSFKAEIDAPKAVIDSVQAKSQFKSPNISDGMAAGGGGGGGSLSVKLTKEDSPKETEKK